MQNWQLQIEERLRKLEEQQTEKIRAVRVEVGSSDVIKRLDTLDRGQQEIKHSLDQIKCDQDDLQEQGNRNAIQMQGVRADIANLQETNSDLQEWRKEDVAYREMHIDKIDRLSAVLDEVLMYADKADKTMATKEDMALLATKQDLAALESQMATKEDLTRQTRQFEHTVEQLRSEQQQMLSEILKRLPPKE
jgi:hypothetical protein